MISINFKPSNLSLEITGHANYAEEGKDIVCSAVSILFYTLVANLDEESMIDIKTKIEKGDSYVTCLPRIESRRYVETVFCTIVNGFRLLAEGYPEHVALHIEEE